MKNEDILMKIKSAKTNHEVAELYDKWSKTYDHDLKIIRPGNKGAFKTVEWFVKYVHIDDHAQNYILSVDFVFLAIGHC